MRQVTFISLLVVSTLCITNVANAMMTPRQIAWIGPHFNFHFGGAGAGISTGIEASFWGAMATLDSLGNPRYLGGDVGAEYHFLRKKWIGYAEFQVSDALFGASVGLAADGDYGVGLQASFWGNYILGTMVRFRQFLGGGYYREGSIGAYVKAPFLIED